MCLIVFALECHPRYRLVLAANRDELFGRPSAPAGFWADAPQVLGGRDLLAGGTWLGVTTDRRLAAVTNYREPRLHRPNAPSRGMLVARFLTQPGKAAEYPTLVQREGHGYGGFNLLVADDGGLFYCSNRSARDVRVHPGIHGLSNHLMDTPWPKVFAAKAGLARLLQADEFETDALFELLAESSPFPDNQLPDTGVGIERERVLSPIFITGPEYGTRSSTIVVIHRDNRLTLLERNFDSRQRLIETREFNLS